MLPILHLNGYKIANPTVLARMRRQRDPRSSSAGYGHEPLFVEGDEPKLMHQAMAEALDVVLRQHPLDPASTPATAARRASGRGGR